MKKYSIVAMLLVALSIPAFSQKTISGVSLPGALKVGDKTLELVGGGIRKKLFIDVYVAALYAQTKGKDGVAISKNDETQAVRLAIVSGLVSSEKMIEATSEGFQKSTGGNTAPLKGKITAFQDVFKKEPIVKGDVYDFVYIPTNGVKVIKNGKAEAVIEGLDFKTALWGIWLGANPADEKLKAGMLGQ